MPFSTVGVGVSGCFVVFPDMTVSYLNLTSPGAYVTVSYLNPTSPGANVTVSYLNITSRGANVTVHTFGVLEHTIHVRNVGFVHFLHTLKNWVIQKDSWKNSTFAQD